MQDELWERVKEVLVEAMALPESQQQAYLDQACGDDAALRAEVESLLHPGHAHVDFLEKPIANLAGDILSEHGLDEGLRIGPYQVLRELGRGGMGTVYLASREGDFNRKVAIKVIKPGLDSETAVARFRKERQILANLDHPYIAKLYEGGTTQRGLPYFVMEYIEGRTVTEYCDQNSLDIRRRLELFAKICSAVQFAHANLVVHRDIKPANVLVTADGQPKLLDFGIAKILQPNRDQTLTVTEMRLMTPEFASPEQIRGATVTTATDVYSLGVLLYQLLTGVRPYHLQSKLFEEVQRIICETTPPKPSEMIRQGMQTGPSETLPDPLTVGALRKTEPRRLRSQLLGDVDNIVMMAMRKEPHRRYASVESFLGDIVRHLDGFPVQAHKETATYLLGKFVARNRWQVISAVAVFLLTVGFAISTYIQAQQVRRQRDLALAGREKFQRISSFLQGIFRTSDPFEGDGGEIVARDLLDRANFQLGLGLDQQPTLRADLLDAMSGAYLGLGNGSQALGLAQQALALRREGEDPAGLVSGLIHLAEIELALGDLNAAEGSLAEAAAADGALPHNDERYWRWVLVNAELLQVRGDFGLAVARLSQLKTLLDQSTAVPFELRVKCLTQLAACHERLGHFEEVKPLFQEAMALRISHYGERHPSVALALNLEAEFFYRRGEFQQAEQLMLKAQSMLQAVLVDHHPVLAELHNNLGAVLEQQGQTARAEALYRQALKAFEKAYGSDHLLAHRCRSNLALFLLRQGNWQEAAGMLEHIMARVESKLGRDHPFYATLLNNSADVNRRLEHYALAQAAYREALEIKQRSLGEDHPEVGWTLESLADLAKLQEDFATAIDLQQQATALFKRAYAAEPHKVASALENLAAIYLAAGRYRQADDAIVEARLLLQSAHGEQRAAELYSLCLHAQIQAAVGHLEQAAEMYQNALHIAAQDSDTSHAMRLYVAASYAQFLADHHQLEAAEAQYRLVLAEATEHYGRDSTRSAARMRRLAAFLLKTGQPQEAFSLVEEALAIYTDARGSLHPTLAKLHHLAADCLKAMGRQAEARAHLSQALQIRKKTLGPDHFRTLESEEALRNP